MKEIILILKEQRERIRAEAEDRMDALTRAMDVLQGLAPENEAAPAMPEETEAPERKTGTPSVVEMLTEAGEALAEGDEERLFTFVEVKKWCLEKWPGEEKKIRNGIYPAAKQLVTKDVWEQMERGFRIHQGTAR